MNRILVFVCVSFFVVGLPTMLNAQIEKDAKIYVAGHRGLVGSAIMRKLHNEGFFNIIVRTFQELDLRDQQATESFFAEQRPDYVFLAAAKVGGILANDVYPAEFIYDNLAIELNVINAAHKYGVKKLLFLGSSCIYPRNCPQPIKEEYLLTSPLEKTNQWYAIAKIAGIKLCQAYNKQYGTNFIACMPTNLYGPNDNFNLETSHVLPALLRKIYNAKQNGEKTFEVWGTGTPRREFLHVDDLVDALFFLMNHYNGDEIVNVGTGKDITIKGLVELIKEVVGYNGDIVYDTSKPDGTPRKLLHVGKLKEIGWEAKISLREGIQHTLDWCTEHNVFV